LSACVYMADLPEIVGSEYITQMTICNIIL
jgi:hypothetical protein